MNAISRKEKITTFKVKTTEEYNIVGRKKKVIHFEEDSYLFFPLK